MIYISYSNVKSLIYEYHIIMRATSEALGMSYFFSKKFRNATMRASLRDTKLLYHVEMLKGKAKVLVLSIVQYRLLYGI